MAQKRASQLASNFLDDGDDLHITPSFQAEEENSSIVGNSSVALFPSSPRRQPHPQHEKFVDSSGPLFLDSNNKSYKNHKSRGLRVSNFLLLRRLGEPKMRQFAKERTSASTNQPAHEGVQADEVPGKSDSFSNVDCDHSIRSSRVNVTTGRSMLVRQNAEVKGRPSLAQVDWDIASISSDYTSTRSQRTLTWDNSSFRSTRTDISHVTIDSFRSKRSEAEKVYRSMYIDNGMSLLGTTEEEDFDNEDLTDENFFLNGTLSSEVEDASYHSSSSPVLREEKRKSGMDKIMKLPNIRQAKMAVNRILQKGMGDDSSDVSSLNLLEEYMKEELPSSDSPVGAHRKRIFSDSDIAFKRIQEFVSRAKERESPSKSTDEHHRPISSPTEPLFEDHPRESILGDFDSGLHDADNEVDHTPRKRTSSASEYEVVSGTMARLERIRDSIPKPNIRPGFGNGSRNWNIRVSKGGTHVALLDDDQTDSGAHTSPRNPDQPRYDLEPVETALWDGEDSDGDLSATMPSTFVEDHDQATELQPSQKLSKVTAINAAKMIASALRPPTATLPNLASKSASYYWHDDSDDNRSHESEEVGRGELSDESFEDLF